MADAAELIAVVDSVIGALRRHRIPHFITGSFASSVHGEFRATNDVDIVAQFESSMLPALFEEWSAAFVADLDQAIRALAAGSSFNLIHRTAFLKVDVFPCVSDFDREAIARAVSLRIPGATEAFPVASLEDILLAKLRGFRMGGETSETQQRDVRQLVALNRDELDLSYLRRWAVTLGVSDLLDRVLGQTRR